MTVLTDNRHSPYINDSFNNDMATSVTEISVIARIEYILRFSKHLVGVINENINKPSSLSSEYIETLSLEEHSNQQTNVALLFCNVKLNDIQVRCRIIEQLFGGCMFDPESALTTSVIKLSKEHSTAISIVVEDAQLLSTQIIVELTQLVLHAKKAGLPINVVLFGNVELAQTISANKETFINKLTLISGGNGQVINVNKFNKSNGFKLAVTDGKTKILLLLTIITALLVGTWYGIENYTTLTFLSKKIENNNKVIQSQNALALKSNTGTIAFEGVINKDNKNGDKVNKEQLIANKPITEKKTNFPRTKLANSNEIYTSIISSGNELNSQNRTRQIATTFEIFKDISHSNEIEIAPLKTKEKELTDQNIASSNDTVQSSSKVIAAPKVVNIVPETLIASTTGEKTGVTKVIENTDSSHKTYYHKFTEGNAVQLISFNNEKKLLAFKDDYRDIESYTFKKRVEGKEYFVLTSKVFPTMTDANNFIDNLPRRMNVAKPWLIPVKMIQQHIETF